MKHKLLRSLLLIALLLSISGTAFAQGSRPPFAQNDSTSHSKDAFGSLLKTGDQGQPMLNASSALTLATTPLVNGNFEQGPGVGWGEYSSNDYMAVLPASPSMYVHSGGWAAWLGGDDNEITEIYQDNVTISGPTSLRLWYLIESWDECGWDYGYVFINSTVIHTWDLCQITQTNGWVALDLNLSAYDGQTVSIAIQATTDDYPDTFSSLFIDDVSLYKNFVDVPYGYWSESFIQSLYNTGVTGGCNLTPLMYCPETTVTRDQMAVFLLKGIHTSSYVPPAVGGTTGFGDVPTDYWAASWIKQLSVEGITGGCGSGNYCPQTTVTRDQMAVFLLRSKYGSLYVPPAVGADTGFGDVPTDHWAAPWIKQLVAEGITAGCGGGNYCPNTPVTRAQMAVFLVRTFNLP